MEKEIKKTLESIRPFLQNDGGDVKYIKFEHNTLYITLIGACANCPMADYTLKQGIEQYLKEEHPQIKKVVNIKEKE